MRRRSPTDAWLLYPETPRAYVDTLKIAHPRSLGERVGVVYVPRRDIE
jgi:hypothetical protein